GKAYRDHALKGAFLVAPVLCCNTGRAGPLWDGKAVRVFSGEPWRVVGLVGHCPDRQRPRARPTPPGGVATRYTHSFPVTLLMRACENGRQDRAAAVAKPVSCGSPRPAGGVPASPSRAPARSETAAGGAGGTRRPQPGGRLEHARELVRRCRS